MRCERRAVLGAATAERAAIVACRMRARQPSALRRASGPDGGSSSPGRFDGAEASEGGSSSRVTGEAIPGRLRPAVGLAIATLRAR
jgi:hypothetical protein